MWRLAPFYVAVAAAPLLFGGIKVESQGALGVLLGLGLALAGPLGGTRLFPRWLSVLLLSVFLLPLVPLPLGVVKILSPERARLAVEFPGSEWVTLSVSPARTAQRVWEIALAAATFVLARRSAMQPGGSKRLAMTLAAALVLLGASDVWSRTHGRESVLGIWNITWGKGAGTFANRNHFANWIYMAALFCGGWTLRELLRGQRKAKVWELAFVGATVVVGLAFAVMSASRAGTGAFVAGLAAAIFLQRRRFKKESYGVAASFVLIGVVAVTLLFGERLVNRLRSEQTGQSLVYKQEIWREGLGMAMKFPVLGAGAGTFVRVFDHFKSGYGDATVLHAENDYVELALEYGWLGAALLLIAIALVAKKAIRVESALMAGLVGALVVFAVHALVEFVSFVPSNLILAAALVGFAAGRSGEKGEEGRSWIGGAAGVAMIAVGILHFVAWPFAVNRELGLFRAEAQKPETRRRAETRMERAISVDPLNWELRLEKAWFDLAYSTNRAAAISNAWLAVRLNPLQGQIPLRFARHFGRRDPDLAMAFLKAVNPGVRKFHQAALDLAWDVTRDPAQIWALTPNTMPALENVIYFARAQKLPGVMAEAAGALEGRMAPEVLGRHFLEADRPAEALRALGNLESFEALRLRAVSLERLGRATEMVGLAQEIFTLTHALRTEYPVNASHAQLAERFRANPNDPAAGLLLAEKVAVMPPVDLKALGELAVKFPAEARIAYLLFRAQLNAGQTNAAAKTAAGLVERLGP